MAKVIGPLFSQEASGQFGKTAVYARRRGQNVVRSYAIPSNPMTAAQIIVRITLAVSGLINKRVFAGRWTLATETMSVVEFSRTLVRTGEVWPSALGRLMIGPFRVNYTESRTEYLALTDPEQGLWTTGAGLFPVNLVAYTRDTDTVTPGFQLFLIQKTLGAVGYGVFVPGTPQTFTQAPE